MCPSEISENDPKVAAADTVRNNLQAAKDVISESEGEWGIVRLAEQASMHGKGYDWEITDFNTDVNRINWPLLCYSGS